MTDDDAALVRAFLATGRVEHFESLVARHRQNVFRVAIAVLGPGRDSYAEDVTQEVFVRVFRKLHEFEGRSTFSTWLYRIAYNRALDHARALRSRPEAELAIDPPARREAGDPLRDRLLAGSIATLPTELRTTVHLHYWLGHTVSEIAGMLGVPEGTVKAWLFRSRFLLARALTKKGVRL